MMKVLKGNITFELPPIGEIISVWRDGPFENYPIRLAILTMEEFLNIKTKAKNILGEPALFAYEDQCAYIFPAPDRDIDIGIRYYPPAVEI